MFWPVTGGHFVDGARASAVTGAGIAWWENHMSDLPRTATHDDRMVPRSPGNRAALTLVGVTLSVLLAIIPTAGSATITQAPQATANLSAAESSRVVSGLDATQAARRLQVADARLSAPRARKSAKRRLVTAPVITPSTPKRRQVLVAKGRLGQAVKRPVVLQRKDRSKWVVAAKGRTTKRGTYTLKTRAPNRTGKVQYRAYAKPIRVKVKRKTKRFPVVTSKPRTITVKNPTPPTPPADTTPPPVPTGLVAVPGDTTVDLTWNPVTGPNTTDLAGYTIYQATNPTGPFTKINPTPTTATSRTITGLTNNTTYYYGLTATDTTGNESAESAPPAPVTPLDPTRLVVVSITETTVGLQWTVPSNTRSQIRRGDGDAPLDDVSEGVQVAEQVGTQVSFTDTSVVSGREYIYALFVLSQSGTWVLESRIPVATPASGQPAAALRPESLIVEGSDSDTVIVRASGEIDVRLASDRSDAVIGAGVLLPVTAATPSGYVGRIASVSANGRTATLEPGELHDIFQYLDLDYDLSDMGPMEVSVPTDPPATQGDRRGITAPERAGKRSGCNTSGLKASIKNLRPTFTPEGHFRYEVRTGLFGVPHTVGFDVRGVIDGKVIMDLDISLTGACQISFLDVRKTKVVSFVPIALEAHFDADFSGTGTITVKDFSVRRKFGFEAKPSVGFETGYEGSMIDTGHEFDSGPVTGGSATLDFSISGNASIGLGATEKKGPVAGTLSAGAKGTVDFVKVSLKAEQRADTCITYNFFSGARWSLYAKAAFQDGKLVDITAESEWDIPGLGIEHSWFGEPKSWPNRCHETGSDSRPPTIVTNQLPEGAVHRPYNTTVRTQDNRNGTWAVTAGQLPDGLTLIAGSGIISGTPTKAQTTTVTITFTDGHRRTTSKQLTLVVAEAQTEPEGVTLPDGFWLVPAPGSGVRTGAPIMYSEQLQAPTGQSGTWSLPDGRLPPGLVLRPNGRIEGIPGGQGDAMYEFEFTDTQGDQVKVPVLLGIIPINLGEICEVGGGTSIGGGITGDRSNFVATEAHRIVMRLNGAIKIDRVISPTVNAPIAEAWTVPYNGFRPTVSIAVDEHQFAYTGGCSLF